MQRTDRLDEPLHVPKKLSMRRLTPLLVFFLIAGLLLPMALGRSKVQDPEVGIAVQAAQSWLDTVDSGDYGGSWD